MPGARRLEAWLNVAEAGMEDLKMVWRSHDRAAQKMRETLLQN